MHYVFLKQFSLLAHSSGESEIYSRVVKSQQTVHGILRAEPRTRRTASLSVRSGG